MRLIWWVIGVDGTCGVNVEQTGQVQTGLAPDPRCVLPCYRHQGVIEDTVPPALAVFWLTLVQIGLCTTGRVGMTQ